MIKVNFKNGTTIDFDLDNEKDKDQFLSWLKAPDFQANVTAFGVIYNGKQHSLPLPRYFRRVRWYAESVFKKKKGKVRKIGERVIAHVDQIKICLLVYTCDPPPPIASVVFVEKIGRQVFPDHDYKKGLGNHDNKS